MDSYDESEAIGGFHTMIQDHLQTPFTTTLLGVEVQVTEVEQDEAGQIVAVCVRGRNRPRVGILDLPLPSAPPAGSEWIEAYGAWVRGG